MQEYSMKELMSHFGVSRRTVIRWLNQQKNVARSSRGKYIIIKDGMVEDTVINIEFNFDMDELTKIYFLLAAPAIIILLGIFLTSL